MFFKRLAGIGLGILFLYGCAGNNLYKSQSTYLNGMGFYNTQKKTELEGITVGNIIQEKSASPFGKNTLFSKEKPSGFFLFGPIAETWKAYYYYFQVRKRIYENLPGAIPQNESDIPVVWNNKVQGFLVYFQTSGRDIFSRWLSRSGKYIPMMKGILESKGMPPDLVYLAMIESGFNVRARSNRGAVGPWQFIYSTGRRYGLRIDPWVDERMDLEKSTRAAADYLQDLYSMFESWELAAAGYNAGEDRVRSAIEKYKVSDFWEISEYTLPEETKDYVPKLIAALIIAKNPEKYGFTGIDYQEPESFEKVSVPPQRSLQDIATITTIDYERLKDLNPSLIRDSTPPGDPYEIYIPEGYKGIVASKYNEIEALEKVEARSDPMRYRVKRGDTLGKIAARYGVSVSALKSVNRIRGSKGIKTGQILTIPLSSDGAYVRSERKTVLKKSENGSVGFSSSGNKASQKSDIKSVISYSVKRGDTLRYIADKYDVSVSDIKKWNNLKSSKLAAGDRLRIYIE